MVKRILLLKLVLWSLLLAGCHREIPVIAGKDSYQTEGVSIINYGNYFQVELDYRTGLSQREMGEALAKGILEMVPDYESLVDSYIAENIPKYEYKYYFFRLEDIKTQLHPEYLEEIMGAASVFSGENQNIWRDQRISRDEFLLFNLFTDVARGTQCSYISVYDSRSATGKTITARSLEWYGGSKNQLPRIQAVITIIYPDRKLCSIGYLGYMGILTGFNDRKIFAGILDAGTNGPYTSEGRRSYTLDLRYALENFQTMDEAVDYMMDIGNLYAFNHVIGFSDPNTSVILENNFSGSGSDNQKVKRAVRNCESKLNKDITWGISDAVAAVNSFILYGNHDNHTPNKYNTKRWKNIKTQLLSKGPKVTVSQLKEVISYHQGSPGVFSESGDIYNKMTLQIVIFEPDSFSLEIFFRPKHNRKNPIHPVFETVQVFQ